MKSNSVQFFLGHPVYNIIAIITYNISRLIMHKKEIYNNEIYF